MNTVAETYIPIPINGFEDEQEKSSKTYKLDLDTGRIAGVTDGIEAVQQAIRKALLTPRFKCLIYDNQYGEDLRESFRNATREYIETAAKELIWDALKPDTRILNVIDFKVSFKDDACYISFTAETIFGTTEVEVSV